MQDFIPTRSAKPGFWLLIGLIALFAGAKPILFDTLDPDCFWHLRVAAQLHRDGIHPLVDDLSFASIKTPWTPYSWLAELGMKAIWDHGGYRAAIAVTAVMQSAIVVLLAATCLEAVTKGSFPVPAVSQTRYLSVVIATAIGTFLMLPYLSFRPVTFAFVLLFMIAWFIVRAVKMGNDPFLTVVPLTILLTNVHLFSFFVPAIALAMALGAMIEGDARAAVRFSILATATSLACLATPMLPGLIRTIFFYSAQDKMVAGPVIAEMQSFARGPMGWIAGVGVIGMLICIAVRYRAIHIGQLICVAVATLLLFKLGRFAPLFALAACPAFAATMPALKDRLLTKPPIVFLLAFVLLIGVGKLVMSFPSRSVALSQWVNRNGPGTPGYPCAAADFIDRSILLSTGHLINEFSWGGYLAWRLDGKYQVLMDGRTQVYSQAFWQSTYLGSDEQRLHFLANIRADAALVSPGKSKFADALMHLGWTRAYADDRAEVLIPPPTGLAASAATN
jgi:hypothetical protein